MKSKKTSATIGLRIDTKREHGYFHVSAVPVWIGLTPDEMDDIDRGNAVRRDITSDTVRTISHTYGALINGLRYENLQVWSQGTDSDSDRKLYGFGVHYDTAYVSHIELRDAVEMAATLTSIERRMEKLYEKWGSVATFDLYLLRVADAIGATRFVVPSKRDSGPRILSPKDGAYRVASLIQEWQTERETAQTA